jgi:hypothetical protein
MELPADDYEPALRYPGNDIMESTPCKLHLKVVNITTKVAVGYALPIGPNPTYHCTLVPHGYAVSGVDQVMSGFEQLKLDYPAGEGDLYELGEAKKTTILWPKEYTALPNWTPRSPAHHPSLPSRQPSPSHHPSPPPLSTEAQSQEWKRTIAAPVMNHNRSLICLLEPLAKVHKLPPKRPYDCTLEENEAMAKEKIEKFFANLKKKQPEQPAPDPKKVRKMMRTLYQPEPRLSSDYDRSILKSHDATKRSTSSSASRKSVP